MLRRCLLVLIVAKPAVAKICGAGAFGRNHTGTDRIVRRTGGTEYFAVPRMFDPAQNRSAFARLMIRKRQSGNLETLLRIEIRETGLDA